MQAGDTIGRRFQLIRPDDAELPGVQRFVARDQRLGADVTVDLVTSLAPTAVIRAAHRARTARDKRLARVLAAGVEREGESKVSYVVTERPKGVRLDALLGRVAFAPDAAGAVMGEAASALTVAALHGEHHGLITGASLTVTDKGRVIVTGVGVAAELAAQAGIGKGRTERADALALARLYVTAVTGLDADAVTAQDLPADLPAAARALCEKVIKGSGPSSLADATAAWGTGDTKVLALLVAEAPTLWWPSAAGGLVAEAEPEAAAPEFDALPELVESTQESLTDESLTEAAVDSDVERDVEGDPAEADGEPRVPVLRAGPVVPGLAPLAPPARPRTRFGGAVDDIDEFHDIVAAQNESAPASLLETTLERLHQRFPASAPLARAAAAVHERAQQSAPINAAPLVLALMGVAVFVAFVIGASKLAEPYVLDGDNGPSQTYPEYTFGVSPSPSVSPSPAP